MDSAANGPTWMYVALGLLALLQVVAGFLLTRATSTVDKLADSVAQLAREAAAEQVKVARAEVEIEGLRKRVPHIEGNREHVDAADREIRRLMVQELQALREWRTKGAA